MKPIKKIILFALLLITTWSAEAFSNSPAPIANESKLDFFHTFNGSLPAQLAITKEKNKFGLVLFFGTTHCPFCHRMKTTVLTEPAVQQYYRQHFQLIDMDIESEALITTQNDINVSYIELSKSHRVRLTPTISFIDTRGITVYRHVGMIVDPQEFLWLGEYVFSGQTSKQSFASYKTKKRQLPKQ
ncbi:MAG: thioredoxin [Piscirickettsiaceae bacterium]|nr:MAG: thioredoxin [Piscirickettsiaceae bacterium]